MEEVLFVAVVKLAAVKEFVVTAAEAGSVETTIDEVVAEAEEVVLAVQDEVLFVVSKLVAADDTVEHEEAVNGVAVVDVVVLQGHCKVGKFELRIVAVLLLLLLLLILLLICLALAVVSNVACCCMFFVLPPRPATLVLLVVGVMVKDAGRLLVLTLNEDVAEVDEVDAAVVDVTIPPTDLLAFATSKVWGVILLLLVLVSDLLLLLLIVLLFTVECCCFNCCSSLIHK